MFSIIHEICFHGKGGYNWDQVYHFPIWLRRFTFEKIKEFYEKEKEASEKSQKTLENKNVINKPDVSKSPKAPTETYKTKVPKK